MISTVKLYDFRNHQLANRQFMVRPANDADLTKYEMLSYDNVKNTGNMVQNIKIPYHANIPLCNMVGMNGKFYDIIAFDNTTFNEKSVVLSLRFNPITSILNNGSWISGLWDRTPTAINRGVKFNIADDALIQSQFIPLDTLKATYTSGVSPFYVQVTATYDIMGGTRQNDLTQYGFFVPYTPEVLSSAFNDKLWPYSGGTAYMSLMDLITSFDNLTSIPPSAIMDVSISRRCPYNYGINGQFFWLKDKDGEQLLPANQNGTHSIYRFIGNQAARSPRWNYDNSINISNLERFCGRVTLVDERGFDVCEIPTEYFGLIVNGSSGLNYSYETIADISGIYTQVQIKGMNKVFTLAEGHLPFIGDAFVEYQTRSLQYDREAIAINAQMMKDENELNKQMMMFRTAMSVASNPVSMGAANSIISLPVEMAAKDASLGISINGMYANQNLKEARIKASPAPATGTAHGLDYCFRSHVLGGAGFRVEKPKNLNDSDFNNYVAYHGYPCGRYAQLPTQEGFIKGIIYSISNTILSINGPELDMLRREISEGFRIVIQ